MRRDKISAMEESGSMESSEFWLPAKKYLTLARLFGGFPLAVGKDWTLHRSSLSPVFLVLYVILIFVLGLGVNLVHFANGLSFDAMIQTTADGGLRETDRFAFLLTFLPHSYSSIAYFLAFRGAAPRWNLLVAEMDRMARKTELKTS